MLSYIKIALASTFSLLLTACDSSEYMAISEGSSYGGIVVDGYIEGATVCLDIDNNSLCDGNESTTSSNSDGTFTLNNVVLERNSFVPIIAYGGKDTATDKEFVGQFKNIVDTSKINDNIVISPLTDLVSNSFLNLTSDEKTDEKLDEIKESISSLLKIDKEVIDKDPFEDKELFAIAQEIQNSKIFLQKIIENNLEKPLTATEKLLLEWTIKEQLLKRDFNLEQVLVEIAFIYKDDLPTQEEGLPDNEELFVVDQMKELTTTLASTLQDMVINIDNLNILQSFIDEKQTDALDNLDKNSSTYLEVVKIDTTNLEMTKTIFKTSDAIYDKQACLAKDGYNSLSNSEKSIIADDGNGISLSSGYIDENIENSEVTIFYPDLEQVLSSNYKVIFKDNYYFRFNENWVNNRNNIVYIMTPKNAEIESNCYRFELNDRIKNDTKGVNVYRYTDI
ncbi:MAG: hypothetical protein U9P38_06735 [Campylobacterota bacterium]|nr:hypothetical protein [Campylobacterota bacterium]